jgi:N-formylglutamate amidohydrolase
MSLPFDQQLYDMFLQADRHEGVDDLGGFAYHLDLSVPAIATAIHAGHRVRKELLPLLEITEAGRLFEEDAATDEMIQGFSSAIWGLDSRVEYDINRPPADALPLTPEKFWGTRVYRTPPSDAMNARSLEKFHAFYRFSGSYVQALLTRHGRCVIYDIHAYNISRQVDKGIMNPPVFNLGSVLLDKKKWGIQIDAWQQQLKSIAIPGHETTVAENDVFFGRAHLCRSFTESGENVLVLPTEISKVYMNEHEGTLNAPVVQALKQGLRKAMQQHSERFAPLSKQPSPKTRAN